MLNKFTKWYALKPWSYHSWKNFGIPIELISEKLGHWSNAFTKRYISINQEDITNIEKKESRLVISKILLRDISL